MATVAAPTVFNPSNQMVNEDPAVKKEADKNTESVIPGEYIGDNYLLMHVFIRSRSHQFIDSFSHSFQFYRYY